MELVTVFNIENNVLEIGHRIANDVSFISHGFLEKFLLALKIGRSTIIIRQNKDNTNDANVHLAQK